MKCFLNLEVPWRKSQSEIKFHLNCCVAWPCAVVPFAFWCSVYFLQVESECLPPPAQMKIPRNTCWSLAFNKTTMEGPICLCRKALLHHVQAIVPDVVLYINIYIYIYMCLLKFALARPTNQIFESDGWLDLPLPRAADWPMPDPRHFPYETFRKIILSPCTRNQRRLPRNVAHHVHRWCKLENQMVKNTSEWICDLNTYSKTVTSIMQPFKLCRRQEAISAVKSIIHHAQIVNWVVGRSTKPV